MMTPQWRPVDSSRITGLGLLGFCLHFHQVNANEPTRRTCPDLI